ncbi:MAG: NAD(P)H-hydrate dehydratase [Silicimonas sp.]|nr:NAD(P)H-hydrate dehydratase [Silicimonas sp.]
MTELLTAAQMRAIEQAAIESGEVTGLELMERAGRGVVEAIFEEWPELAKTSHRAVVLCGPGNNGGDGFVVARLLKEWGWEVEVFLYGDADKLPPDARVNYERWGELGKTEPLDTESGLTALETDPGLDVLIDSLFGTGLTRPVDLMSVFGSIYELREWSTEGQLRRPCKVVAVDIPSGICSDSGRAIGEAKEPHYECPAAFAHLTVTFHRQKIGHGLSDYIPHSSKVAVADIGLEGIQSGKTVGLTGSLQRLNKFREHKYTHGHALILSGGPGKTGAARLAARGALRIGAGLVTLGCPQQALWEVAAHSTAVMCAPLDGAPGLNETLQDQRLNALCLGPGMGLGADTQAMVLAALEAKRATVLDADALTRFERNPQVLFDALHEGVVLTPHGGEFKRLFPDIAEKLDSPATKGPAYSKVDATREAAARAGCTVLFKGPDTVIAAPDGRCSINSSAYERAAPWLATAGSGDVLAGFITGLLARGFAPMQAAETGAWLHTECALSFGPGLIAEDLPEELPKVFRSLFDTTAQK